MATGNRIPRCGSFTCLLRRFGLTRSASEPIWVDEPRSGERVREALQQVSSFAVDTEAAGFHRYSDRICLIQVTVGSSTYLLDALAFDAGPPLRDALADPAKAVFLHGSDYDLRLLDRDVGVRVRHIVDTQVAAALCGESQTGLSSLMERYFDLRLSKKFQRADWAKRPLTKEQLAYAADDTRRLEALWDILRERLVELDRLAWAEEEFRLLEEIRWTEDTADFDPASRLKRGRKLPPATLEGFRVGWHWRDALARKRDRAPFRIAEDRVLLAVAQGEVPDVEALVATRGISRSVAQEHGKALLASVAEATRRPPDEIASYPRNSTGRYERPTKEEEDRFDRLKRARNARADELGLDRGLLVPNATLMEIARAAPATAEALGAVPTLKAWQREAAGEALLAAAIN